MKRAIRTALICSLCLTFLLPAAADSAKSLYAKGKNAEARQNYEQAYDFYKQAYDQKPTGCGSWPGLRMCIADNSCGRRAVSTKRWPSSRKPQRLILQARLPGRKSKSPAG